MRDREGQFAFGAILGHEAFGEGVRLIALRVGSSEYKGQEDVQLVMVIRVPADGWRDRPVGSIFEPFGYKEVVEE